MRIVFLGPPGAGKGTQAETISREKKLPHISSGNLLREAVETDTETGRKAREYIEKGLLVPDQIVVDIIKDRIVKDDCKDGFILDGFPRTVSQAKVLDEMLKQLGNKLDLVFYFSVSEESVILRLSGRRICSSCGANYHIKFVPSSKDGICDKCGGKLYQRADDKLETVSERLRVYHDQTEDLVEYYKKNGILKEIIADANIKVITKNIFDAIKCTQKNRPLIGYGVV
ncbi:MAG: adenylate kinase [Candidatus Brocadia sp. AMX2]|uniref:Adenylate kinase n=1 Tax=Candidatus Brocadia sinica JPN1 TaxID=1197129 RepID=A0ABQ0JY99_9BACT|nr:MULTISPECIES: adenylate kinase [Brocadia]KXK26344.1 MAG: adenylate kinase [Candidatus Brocadia sinica]MBC6932916.1 adenylate kinase [Candidatus Brocadia sp.]MBL1167598.1 adenylate kinase [Candidatus Brocadia sp. AMX1]NOG40513.1 adenylate kinase [Planctomycetota bacterium]KAA0242059.1 MAG: adenylate kinase [Candidatus Brocadia sp. AMX2]